MGYPAKVVFKHGVVSAESLIKSRWRRPRPKRKRWKNVCFYSYL